MGQLLPIIAALVLQTPCADTFRAIDWQPEYVETVEPGLNCSTVALLTHCSEKFDPLGVSGPGVRRCVRTMKENGLPVLYLHDKYNENNPPWMYLYDDWRPTAFVRSDVGHISLDLTDINHVVCMGGYYGQCERSTVSDIVKTWTNSDRTSDMRVTQIVDATFTVAQHVYWEDQFRADVRHQLFQVAKKRHQNAVLTVDDVLRRINDRDIEPQFVQRQLPFVSADINIVLDYFGRQITLQRASNFKTKAASNAEDADAADEKAPTDEATQNKPATLTFAFRRSDDFLRFDSPVIDTDGPPRWVRRRSLSNVVSQTSSSPKPTASRSVIVSPEPEPGFPPGTTTNTPFESRVISSPVEGEVIIRKPIEGQIIRIVE